jgi:hypothetical protein
MVECLKVKNKTIVAAISLALIDESGSTSLRLKAATGLGGWRALCIFRLPFRP